MPHYHHHNPKLLIRYLGYQETNTKVTLCIGDANHTFLSILSLSVRGELALFV